MHERSLHFLDFSGRHADLASGIHIAWGNLEKRAHPGKMCLDVIVLVGRIKEWSIPPLRLEYGFL